MRRAASRHGGALGVAAIVAALGALTACAPSPVTSESTSVVIATPTGAPNPVATETPAPALVPDGTAAANLPYFRQVVLAVWSGPDPVSGRAYIDALVAAGFNKSAMQVTEDDSTLGNPAESIEFSVAWRDACLVGQVGPAIGDPVVTVLPLLAEGGCLLGHTRTIDW